MSAVRSKLWNVSRWGTVEVGYGDQLHFSTAVFPGRPTSFLLLTCGDDDGLTTYDMLQDPIYNLSNTHGNAKMHMNQCSTISAFV